MEMVGWDGDRTCAHRAAAAGGRWAGGQAGECIPACKGVRVTAGMQAGFKIRSVEYAATGYFFFSVNWDGS